MVLQVWCMSFYGINLSLMILLVVLISFLRYVGTLFVVMFLHQYHTYLLHYDYWLWINKLGVFGHCDWKGDLSVNHWGIWSIKTFNATNKMCSPVSIRIRLIYITSFKFFALEFNFCTLGVLVVFCHLWNLSYQRCSKRT
jgi:hypothetical protein